MNGRPDAGKVPGDEIDPRVIADDRQRAEVALAAKLFLEWHEFAPDPGKIDPAPVHEFAENFYVALDREMSGSPATPDYWANVEWMAAEIAVRWWRAEAKDKGCEYVYISSQAAIHQAIVFYGAKK